MSTDALTWKDYITMTAAAVGAVLGVMNTWNAINQRRVRLRVAPNFVFTLDGTPIGLSIEVINLSAFAVTVAEVGFSGSGRRRVPVLAPHFPDNRSLPCRLEPREAISAMFGPRDFGVPDMKLGSAYARTACGRKVYGNSPAGRQFSKMIRELAEQGVGQ